jgi:hypothetical protein
MARSQDSEKTLFSKTYEGARDKKRFYKLVRLQYEDLAPSDATLKMLGEDLVRHPRGNTRQFVEAFKRDGLIPDLDILFAAYEFLRKKMAISVTQQAQIADFQGKYRIYRRSLEDNLVEGSITIGKKGPVPWFCHSSRQKLFGRPAKVFKHEGFVFFEHGRIHLFGFGEHYLRPVTLKLVENPRNDPMPGILLTEKVEEDGDLIPLSAKTVMVHETIDINLVDLDVYLGNNSALDGVLYGWIKPAEVANRIRVDGPAVRQAKDSAAARRAPAADQ